MIITELQPDILLLKPRADFYASKHPLAEDTYLVLEISDTTLRYDCDRKVPLTCCISGSRFQG
jgi:hypothetical protein